MLAGGDMDAKKGHFEQSPWFRNCRRTPGDGGITEQLYNPVRRIHLARNGQVNWAEGKLGRSLPK